MNEEIREAFGLLHVSHIVDACRKLKIDLRTAPPDIRPVSPTMRLAGRVFPARHYGSLDIVLEALELMEEGEVLVIDANGRNDMACIGDLTVIQAQAFHLEGIVVWGCHRDTTELLRLNFPVFSSGTCPHGPLHRDTRPEDALVAAWIGPHRVTQSDVVFGDADGIVFVPYERLDDVIAAARAIYKTERHQISRVLEGHSLQEQLRFDDYLAQRKANPDYSFSEHLRKVGGATGE